MTWTYKYLDSFKKHRYLSAETDTGAELMFVPDLTKGMYAICVRSNLGNGKLAEAYWLEDEKRFCYDANTSQKVTSSKHVKLLKNLSYYRKELEELAQIKPKHKQVLTDMIAAAEQMKYRRCA